MGTQPQLHERSVTDVLANMIGDSRGAGGADAPAAWVALPASSASARQALLPGSMSMSMGLSIGTPFSMSMSIPMSVPLPPSDSLDWASAGRLSAGGLATIFTNTTMPGDVGDAVLGECEGEAFAEALLPRGSAERSGADTLGSWHGAAGALTASEAVSAAQLPVRLLQVWNWGSSACMHIRISGTDAQYSMAPVIVTGGSRIWAEPCLHWPATSSPFAAHRTAKCSMVQ